MRRILTNPAYCGDYTYRRRTGDPTRGRNRYGHWRARRANQDETTIIHDHHSGYVSREAWQEIQEILRMNAPAKNRRNLGPGGALLQGLVCCGMHGDARSSVDYKEGCAGGMRGAFYYHCNGDYSRGGPQCGVASGRPLDLAVVRAVFSRLTRPTLEVVKSELAEARKNSLGEGHARALAREQVRRRIEDLRARYLLVSPALRNLAEDLEVQLNNAIGDLKRLDKENPAEAPEFTMFTNEAFEELLDICKDLPGLFYAATTTHRDRKEILRTMIDRVRIVERTPEIIRVLVFWADGTEPTAVEVLLFRFAHRLIRGLAEQGFSNVEIAKRLNEMNLVTSRGKPWTREVVWVVRHYGKGGKQAARKHRKAS